MSQLQISRQATKPFSTQGIVAKPSQVVITEPYGPTRLQQSGQPFNQAVGPCVGACNRRKRQNDQPTHIDGTHTLVNQLIEKAKVLRSNRLDGSRRQRGQPRSQLSDADGSRLHIFPAVVSTPKTLPLRAARCDVRRRLIGVLESVVPHLA
jgi:hypothetical protein